MNRICSAVHGVASRGAVDRHNRKFLCVNINQGKIKSSILQASQQLNVDLILGKSVTPCQISYAQRRQHLTTITEAK